MTLQALFQTFNARFLGPEEVASTFVAPKQFETILMRNHTLVVGPRGSGKTTLLKMLHPAALNAYKAESANSDRELANYTGVYIGVDRMWSEQLRVVGGGSDDKLHHILASAAFCTNVLRAIVDSMIFRLAPSQEEAATRYRGIFLTVPQEEEISSGLSSAWRFSERYKSLVSISLALNSRLMEIQIFASKEHVLGTDGRKERIAQQDWLLLPLVESISAGLRVFDSMAGESDARWALLFDELEIAPPWLTALLLPLLRSTDQKLIFKLSLSPIIANLDQYQSALGASKGHDYSTVPLWYWKKRDATRFSYDLFKQIAKIHGLGDYSPTDLFGESLVESDEEGQDDVSRYAAPSGFRYRQFHKLLSLDSSFRDYVRHKKWNLEKIPEMDEDKRAELRKITSIVTLRLTFKNFDARPSHRRQKVRSRKNPDIYSGASFLFSLVEGNPRLFIFLIGKLILIASKQEKPFVERNIQASEAEQIQDNFRLFLRTIPYSTNDNMPHRRGLLAFLDAVGESLSDSFMRDNFTADPILSFVVTPDTARSDQDAIASALIHGALILVPADQSPGVLSSVVGSRIRLSYLLAMQYKLPLMLGREANLENIQKESKLQMELSLDE